MTRAPSARRPAFCAGPAADGDVARTAARRWLTLTQLEAATRAGIKPGRTAPQRIVTGPSMARSGIAVARSRPGVDPEVGARRNFPMISELMYAAIRRDMGRIQKERGQGPNGSVRLDLGNCEFDAICAVPGRYIVRIGAGDNRAFSSNLMWPRPDSRNPSLVSVEARRRTIFKSTSPIPQVAKIFHGWGVIASK